MSDERLPAYRTTVDVFLEAASEDEAIDALEALAGTTVILDGRTVFVEECYAVEGDPIDPSSFEGNGALLYPGEATIAIRIDSFEDAEWAFRSLNGSSTVDEDGREVSFDLVGAPVEPTTVPAAALERPDVEIEISAAAHRYAWERGGSVYVWGESFGGGFVRLEAATSLPLRHGVEFVPEAEIEEDGRVVSVHLEDGLSTRLTIRLRRFPRTKLVVAQRTGSIV